jgi:hypothetical protein
LSRRNEEKRGKWMAVTELVPTWMKEISQSYEGDTWAQVYVGCLIIPVFAV